MVTTIAAKQVAAADVQVLENAGAQLPEGSQVRVLLDTLARALGRGVGAALVEQDTQMSPNEAADLLGMSRPHLLTFVDAGALRFTRVGSHRRVAASPRATLLTSQPVAKRLASSLLRPRPALPRRRAHDRQMAPVTAEALAEVDDL